MEPELLGKILISLVGILLLAYFLMGLWQQTGFDSFRYGLAWMFVFVSGLICLFLFDWIK